MKQDHNNRLQLKTRQNLYGLLYLSNIICLCICAVCVKDRVNLERAKKEKEVLKDR